MSSTVLSLIAFAFVFSAALFGMLLRRLLPEHHLSAETKETVKLAMGFVATMAALILGLLVASAKDYYDKQASGVTQMAAKIVFLDRLLANYGPGAENVRVQYRSAAEQVAKRMWPSGDSQGSDLDPSALRTEAILPAIDALSPTTELQATLKSQALSASFELGQLRWLEYEQANSSASLPILGILVFWIAVLFVSFALFAPSNGTVVAALLLAAASVAGALFLILELRSPFRGFLQIPPTVLFDAIGHLGK